jgi:hypothetical protein
VGSLEVYSLCNKEKKVEGFPVCWLMFISQQHLNRVPPEEKEYMQSLEFTRWISSLVFNLAILVNLNTFIYKNCS